MVHLKILPNLNALLLLLIVISACNGQEIPKLAEARQQTDKPFLLDSSAQISEYIVEIFEDSKGNLWFGTMSDGAARFDGKSLTYFSTKDGLCDNTVPCIVEDREGNLWFGTHNGASKYDGKTFTNFGRAEGLHGAGCNLLIDKNGNIWAGTNHGAFRYNGLFFSPFNIPNPGIENPTCKWEVGKVWSLTEDKKGNIWFGRDGLGACKYDGATFTHFSKKDGLCSNNISRIIEDKQGNLWFGCLGSDQRDSKEGGVSRYDGNTFHHYPKLAGLHENDIYTIYADNDGTIWIGATGLGIYRFEGESYQLFKGTDRMDLTWSYGVQSSLEDSKGTLWFGFSGGLFRFDGSAIVNVSKGGLWK